MHESGQFGAHQLLIRRRQRGGRIKLAGALGILGFQREGGLAAAAFAGMALFAEVPGLVHGNAKQPGLKPAFTLKRFDVLDDGKKDFLADFAGILSGEFGRELEDKAAGRGIMPVE